MSQSVSRLAPWDARLTRDRNAMPASIFEADGWVPPGMSTEPFIRISWTRYRAALRRHRWLIGGMLLLGTAVGVAVTRMLEPEYQVDATLRIASDVAAPEPSGAAPMRVASTMQIGSWPELLTSFAILEKVVRRMSLQVIPANPHDSPLFAGFDVDDRVLPGKYELRLDASGWQSQLFDGKGRRLQRGVIGDSIGNAVGFRWKPNAAALRPGHGVKFTVVSVREAALGLQRRLTTSFSQKSNLLGVTLRGSDPARITSIMNALLDELITTAAELKKRKTRETSIALREQIAQTGKKLEESEAALESFRSQSATVPFTEPAATNIAAQSRGPMFESYMSRTTERDSVRWERMALERTLALVQSGALDASALWSIAAVNNRSPAELEAAISALSAKEAQLRSVRAAYSDDNAIVRDLRREISEIRSTRIPRVAAQVAAQLRQQERELEEQRQSIQQQLQTVPTRTTQEARLQRSVEADGVRYGALKARQDETAMADRNTRADVSVLDPPDAPERQNLDRAPFIVLLALMLSAGAAMVGAVLWDRLDARFRYADQATHDLGLEVVGAVPDLTAPEGQQNALEAAQLIEAFRAIRLHVSHALESTNGVALTISSPGPGDGKSFVSAHLASAFADAGLTTILVDGDIRRGELHSRFALQRAAGLVDYLAKKTQLDTLLHSTAHRKLTLMTRGTAYEPEDSDLLVSPRMVALVEELKHRYDVVLVDSPPLGAGIDPFVLGAATGRLLLVLRPGTTDRRMAEAKLKLVRRLPIRLLGVVLNAMQDEGANQYYAFADPTKTGRGRGARESSRDTPSASSAR
jgi:capsular exopolysaccharide synthesis family protein